MILSFFNYFFQSQKPARAFLPRPLLRAETQNEIPPNFKKLVVEVLRNPFPRKMLSQNRVRIVFAYPSFSLRESSTPRVEALQRTDVRLVICLEKSSRK